RVALDPDRVVQPVALRLGAGLLGEREARGLRLLRGAAQGVDDGLAAGGETLDLRRSAEVGLGRVLDDERVELAGVERLDEALRDRGRGGRAASAAAGGRHGERRARLSDDENDRGDRGKQTTRHRQSPPLTNTGRKDPLPAGRPGTTTTRRLEFRTLLPR